jgi:nitroreductase
MNVNEALQIRRSCRAFKPDPVKRDTLLTVINDALHTPSWANTRPWEVFVACGKLLKEINQAYLENHRKNVPQAPDIPRPKGCPETFNDRRKELF